MTATAPCRRIALTGATGFVGAALARRLLAHGYRLNLLLRPGRALPPGLDADTVTAVRGELADSDALLRLVGDAGSVVHCAGAVRGAWPGDFDAANADGTHNLAMAFATRNPEGHFIHISSLAARHPELSWYARSKRAAEGRVYASGLTRVCVLRPPAIYGPGDREMLPLLRMLLAGRALRVSNPRQRLSLLHVEDLATAVSAALAAGASGLYTPEDGAGGYTWDDLCRAAGEVSGKPVRALAVPRTALLSLARANLTVARITGRKPMLTPGKVRELHHPDWSCNAEALAQAIDWEPAIDLRAGLTEIRQAHTRDGVGVFTR